MPNKSNIDKRTIQSQNFEQKIREWSIKEQIRIDREAEQLINELDIIKDLILANLKLNK
jgi:hypothetical protein